MMGLAIEVAVPELMVNGVKMSPKVMRPLACEQFLGGDTLDNAQIEYIFASFDGSESKKSYWADLNLLDEWFGATVEIAVPVVNAQKKKEMRVVHYGRIEQLKFGCGSNPDTAVFTSLMQPPFFGNAPVGIHTVHHGDIDVQSGINEGVRIVRIDDPIVFNGYADIDRHAYFADASDIVSNRSLLEYSIKRDDGKKLNNDETYLFVPLELRESPRATKWQRDKKILSTQTPWSLRTAARYLCASTNHERHVLNPGSKGYDVLPDTPLPRTEITQGYLPGMLDDLLTPWGYTWHVDYEKPGIRRIKFVQLGKGTPAKINLQRPGSGFADWDKTNVDEFDCDLSISTAVNTIIAVGDYMAVEGTFELQRVGARRWALNEAHDYEAPATGMLDGREVSDHFIPRWRPRDLFNEHVMPTNEAIASHVMRRRRFLPTLSQVGETTEGVFDSHPKGNIPPGVYVEFKDVDGEWRDIITRFDSAAQRSIRVLEDECAIEFDFPDDEEERTDPDLLAYLSETNTGAHLRVTATLVSDWRIQTKVRLNAGNESVQGEEEVAWVWDARQRYQCRRRQAYGDNTSIFATHQWSTETETAHQIIDRMTRDCRQLLASIDAAKLQSGIALNRCGHEIKLGQTARDISGRELSLRITPEIAYNDRWPTIVGISWDFINQSSVARLSSDVPDPFGPLDIQRGGRSNYA